MVKETVDVFLTERWGNGEDQRSVMRKGKRIEGGGDRIRIDSSYPPVCLDCKLKLDGFFICSSLRSLHTSSLFQSHREVGVVKGKR